MIRLEDASFAIEGRPVLEKVTATFITGALTCILGSNGAGKTTLLNLMTGQSKASQGRVVLDEKDASSLPSKDVARRFAILPQGLQDPAYVTVMELVALARFRPGNGLGWRLQESDHVAIDASLRRCDVDRLGGRTFRELSGGEKQRAWLAFCLAQGKKFIVLDESLAALDYPTRRAFFGLLSGLAEDGRAVILVTHDVELASQFATRILALRAGTLVYDGPPHSDLPSLLGDHGGPLSSV